MGTKLQPSDFVHLHNHTHHSVLDGLTKIPALTELVKDYGMEAVAITDHGTMSGVVEFYKAATETGIKPIIGMEAYVAARSRFDRDPAHDKARYHLTVLAQTQLGYENLMKLSSKANLEGMYYKPRIDHELLEELNEGLIILSGCASSELGENLRMDNYAEALKIAKWYKSVFGDRYYLELQDHGHLESPTAWDVQVKINAGLEKIAAELNIPMVVTSDGHYLKHSDQDAHEILLCVGTGSLLSDQKRMSLKDFELHVTDPNEIIARWEKTHPEAVRNTRKIADLCNVELELGKILIPTFPTPKGFNEKAWLDELVYKGLAWRYGDIPTREEALELKLEEAKKRIPSDVMERANYELGVVDQMGFNGYFLIVQDFINWGKEQGIVFGPGRGSAAGSIIAYSLRITELDPLKYDLIFERFLNPDRISMPDVDVDIQDTRRDEVIAYCTEKYGAGRVANIVTFGKMAARAAIRDVARVLDVPYAEANRIAKLVPPPIQGRHIPLSKSVVEDADLKHEYESSPVVKEVFDYAINLEGTIRSHGVHAAGVVIAPDEIIKWTPVEMSQKGVVATQYPMGPIEELGLLKMDFLGLSNLSIIQNALDIVESAYHNKIDILELPLDDEKTFELFQRGDTTGVFQFESAGMKRYLRELRPTVFEDIIAMGALYRPGPLSAGLTDRFIARKNGREAVSFDHELMRPALKDTYGVMVYQEQFMQIVRDMCGFTGAESDTLRKAVGKKKRDLMDKFRDQVIEGASKNGVDRKIAEKFWADLEGFADYAFNKSHAACYGLVSYWTAYLKAHYPDAFMAALMTSNRDDTDKLAIQITECKHMGIQVLSPDINESYTDFAVVPGENKVRFGLAAVKGVGTNVVEEILKARKSGKFEGVIDFAKRVDNKVNNKKTWESLVKAGAFDSMADRSDVLFSLESIQAFATKIHKEAISGQTDLFGSFGDQVQVSVEIKPAPVKATDKERLAWERELLGLFISAHPLDAYETYFDEQTVPLSELNSNMEGRIVTIGGLITAVRTIITKSGTKMAFVRMEDKFGETELIVFPKVYEEVGAKLVQDATVKVTGKVSAKDQAGNITGDVKITTDSMEFLNDDDMKNYQSTGRKMSKPKYAAASASPGGRSTPKSLPVATAMIEPKTLYIKIANADDSSALEEFRTICAAHPGETDVVLVIGANKSAVRLPFKVSENPNLIGSLVKLLGEDAVALK